MKTTIKTLYYTLLLIVVVSCSKSSTTSSTQNSIVLDTSTSYEELDIAYGEDNDQKFDLYLPENRDSNTETVILIHGGAWVSGDKSDMDYIKDLLKSEFPNLAIANINYRLANADARPLPMQTDDISSVVDYLKNKKTEYTISDNIGFIGTSAGGHLSLLWSYAFDTEANCKMVCSIVGPTNLKDPEYANSTDPELQQIISLFGETPTDEYLEDASPLFQATATSAPTILFYGGKDPLIPNSQGMDLRDKLQELGVTHEFTFYPDEGHGWDGLELLDTLQKLKGFMETHLN